MSDELTNSLIKLESASSITVLKPGKPMPAIHKKAADDVHTPQVSAGFVRLFKDFYEVNHQNEIDTKTKKKIKEKETFTRYLQVPGQDKAGIFNTREIYFIPLEFKNSRMYFAGAYNPNEKRAPDCQSPNSIVPQTAKYAVSCEACDFSKWQNHTPPPCGEKPELLVLDMTSKTIKDPEIAKAVTAEAVTIAFAKSSIKAINQLKKELAEPQLFDDGTYGPIDMTQYLVKATLTVASDPEGKELNFCVPTFEIVGNVPVEVSEQLLEMLNRPSAQHGNKTVRELFIGRTEPFASVDAETEKPDEVKKVETKPDEVKKVETKPVQTVEVKSEPVKEEPKETPKEEPETVEVESTPVAPPAPVVEEDDSDEVIF